MEEGYPYSWTKDFDMGEQNGVTYSKSKTIKLLLGLGTRRTPFISYAHLVLISITELSFLCSLSPVVML